MSNFKTNFFRGKTKVALWGIKCIQMNETTISGGLVFIFLGKNWAKQGLGENQVIPQGGEINRIFWIARIA